MKNIKLEKLLIIILGVLEDYDFFFGNKILFLFLFILEVVKVKIWLFFNINIYYYDVIKIILFIFEID